MGVRHPSHIEEDALFQQLDFSKEATDQPNHSVIRHQLALFLCPSAVRSHDLVTGPATSALPPSSTKYRAAISDYHATPGVYWKPSKAKDPEYKNVLLGAWGEPMFKTDHAFTSVRKLRSNRITDGLAQTAILCEKAGMPDVHRRDEPPQLYDPDADPKSHPHGSGATWGVSSPWFWMLLVQYDDLGGVNVYNYRGFFSFHLAVPTRPFATDQCAWWPKIQM